MFKFAVILILCQLALAQGYDAFAEDYADCKIRCDSDYTDCTNRPPASEPEVQDAIIASCNQRLQSCAADCESLRPAEQPNGTESNPDIIYK